MRKQSLFGDKTRFSNVMKTRISPKITSREIGLSMTIISQ
ncbi:hypothetical protein BN2497_2879 [Janthinobacterium sp. CG23_2]|nr:hypothetical protein BN2497_2879 [Janthinobacterium sp. CG23_2]CUU27837.1 hypothetical protein BN3177_2879 [Janthinobacterium sp. CG23_2]